MTYALQHEAGDRSAPAIVLVPGLEGTALLFYRQIPLLARRFAVFTFALPDDPVRGMEELVRDLRDAIADAGCAPAILCGESFGGALALSVALQHSDMLRGLIIINSFSALRMPIRMRLGPAVMRSIPWGVMPLVRRLTEWRLHSPHALPEDLQEFRERSRSIGRLGYIRRIEILREYDIRDRLSEIGVPTLFLAGDRDRLIPSVSEARFMAERVPRSTVVILEGFGHVCLINHDLDLLEHVGPWFDALARAKPD